MSSSNDSTATTAAYYRISSRNLNAHPEEVLPADATQAIAGQEAYLPPSDAIDAASLHVSAARRVFEPAPKVGNEGDLTTPLEATSWRVSEDEFIVKIDASPLHMSAAKRMFDKQRRQQANATKELPVVAEEQVATTETHHEGEFQKFWSKMLKIYSGSTSGGK